MTISDQFTPSLPQRTPALWLRHLSRLGLLTTALLGASAGAGAGAAAAGSPFDPAAAGPSASLAPPSLFARTCGEGTIGSESRDMKDSR